VQLWIFSGCLYLKIFYFTKSYTDQSWALTRLRWLSEVKIFLEKKSLWISLITLICKSSGVFLLQNHCSSPQRHGLPVSGDGQPHARILRLLRQLLPRQEAMIDRFHVDRDNLSVRRSAADTDDISGRHGDGIAMQKLRCA
jgi:hypothetical protein